MKESIFGIFFDVVACFFIEERKREEKPGENVEGEGDTAVIWIEDAKRENKNTYKDESKMS
ncbi:MAG: hypothetical protein A2912_03725 [Candidatus Buchananbacteria bacterium RIFCSPLOWO2_01_FULL_40_23b]|uniref:Uncharacterized protein n=1 Tax=Candidatus Buchananbacteria bacterium RIFCSPLOWO2_01_FULL_40_23b TaxID=1797544 RepID=A0A1G1YMN7_9BACT|nr:MAG: hypothetical protein A2912_03725 [Candidatus Buchananbacteria bacterium RIFCSPLOWO2_01_FULL_40_23b]